MPKKPIHPVFSEFEVKFPDGLLEPMLGAARARQRRKFDFAGLRSRIGETQALVQAAQKALQSKGAGRVAKAKASLTSAASHLDAIHRSLEKLT